MKLTKVTLTGADNSVNPRDLFQLTEKYPFVEWAILVSRKSKSGKRFPTSDWLQKLSDLEDANYDTEMNYSCHLCGEYVTEFLKGDVNFISEIGNAWTMFQRVQINTHGEPHKVNIRKLPQILSVFDDREFIFQYDNVNTIALDAVAEFGSGCYSALFDLSHGAGVLPSDWPMPLPNVMCGYAGGLSPENVEEQILKLQSVVGDSEIWIDMETKIRSNNDKQFDLGKCEKVLSICEKYVYGQ